MTNLFDHDPYPGNPKILFIGLGASSHTHSWIDLLSGAELNMRLFSVPGGGVPPVDWKVPAYLCEPSAQLPEGMGFEFRRSFFPLPEEMRLFEARFKRNWLFGPLILLKKVLNLCGDLLGMPPVSYNYSQYRYQVIGMPRPEIPWISSPEEWLAQIIRNWQPDIIHTLGLFDGQGGEYYFNVRRKFQLEGIGTWVLQLRGGSDIALRRYDPGNASQIHEVFKSCDQIISDNTVNIQYAKQIGLAHKIASIAPIPGTGGVDIGGISEVEFPSNKERIILWPKAYESMWSKALPILEALKIAWEQIKPCKVVMAASTLETEAWFWALPTEIRESCTIVRRIPHEQLLDLMHKARIVLIPSLIDGVPNTLYEAMLCGTFPIVSPLDTITPLVSEPQNVLFARNLYPMEIANALIKAMNNDPLVDSAAYNNLSLVKMIASRRQISERTVAYYRELCAEKEG